ncbi:MAG: LPP20 family lipoprotein [Candidatus Marinimicrobia bacterium]|nr:LPP20 family lipoprotein [Candidatus Neomarinimicrobiota bacterium]MCF7839298.1 LPP20 family lipoprotein [Candidatus Neomarinimicrobiota bacterium]MCF7903086.1 LPP20 family lipoprotein [Candidatus Neomarinimicrobiota bacterium]
MARRLQIAILTMALVGLTACSQSGNLLRTPPAWTQRDPVLPGYFYAIGIQEGRENGAELAAQQGRDEMSKALQPMVLAWMENYVVSRAGMINEEQYFYLKQILPAMLDMLLLETQIEDTYSSGGKYWVLLKLHEDASRELVANALENDEILRQKMQSSP